MVLFPRSLFGRNLLLIVLLIALAQFGSAVLVRELILRPRLDAIADGLARNIAAIRGGLVALPLPQRAAFVDEFNRLGLAGAHDAPAEGTLQPQLTSLDLDFVRSVSLRVAAEGAEVLWRREAGGSLALRLTVEGAPYWVVLPGVLPPRGFTGAWVAASITSAALALLGAIAIQRRLNRPLERVVRAADALARGTSPPRLPEDGPLETATLAQSFNQLSASLAQTDRERALMLAGVSHDLRTPLTKLRLGVEILAERVDPELRSSMTRSIEEMDSIVGQFLDFARIETAEPFVDVDIEALAREVGSAYADHGQLVEMRLVGVPPVRIRPQALRRCLTNLVENAFRHGSPPVVMATGVDAAWVWIEVRDLGTGVATGEIEALKQPFRRAQAARGGAPGAGLGLAIVDRITRSHGGRLDLSANAPRGLCARIKLPRQKV